MSIYFSNFLQVFLSILFIYTNTNFQYFFTRKKAFLKQGANYLAKICAEYNEEKEIKICEIESKIEINNSVGEWIKEIEENVKKNKKVHRSDRKEIEEYRYNKGILAKNIPEVERIIKFAEVSSLMYR